ncbi:baculoviral IAP repeat-containing protein 1-like isoform X1 [Lepisosteus oculatus]|uniref:baculoviral IAP repeat-containing protein 1-like isoform X1 n=1 Tax=Lepisosteus oculatus TaxID=7918 RepID=UPI003722EE47
MAHAREEPEEHPETELEDWELHCACFMNISEKATSEYYSHSLKAAVKDNARGYDYKMRSELARLKSFESYPSLSPFAPEELAGAGFFYFGYGSAVQCFCCGVVVTIASFQTPTQLHQKYQEDCAFQKGLEVGNINKYDIRVKGLESSGPVGYTEDSERLGTFSNWPYYCETEPAVLSDCGFFYTGVKDHVQCFSCGGRLGDWEVASDPWREHAKWFPECNYLRSRLSEGAILGHVRSYVGFHGITAKHYFVDKVSEETEIAEQSQKASSEEILRNIFENECSRMESYFQWPSDSAAVPSKLAKAGFFYTGVKDHVQCFSCGGRLGDWEVASDPWREHAKWFPECDYLHSRLSEREILEHIRSYVGFHGITAKHYFVDKVSEETEIADQSQKASSEEILRSIFENECSRMESYFQWPSDSAAVPSKLAKAGFFYTGEEETVQCFQCGGRISHWPEGADPVQEHQKIFSQCQYIVNISQNPQQSDTAVSLKKELNQDTGVSARLLLSSSTESRLELNMLEKEARNLQFLLKKAYATKEFSRSFPFSDIHIPFDIRLLYTQVVMETKDFRNIPLAQVTLPEVLRDLRNITVLEGQLGSGKTACLKMIAMLWAQGVCPVLRRFELVFYIPLNCAPEKLSVTEILRDHLLKEELGISESTFQELIRHYRERVLFLLDEFGKDASPLPMLIEELIHRTHLWKIQVIVGVRTQSLYLIRKHAELLIAILDFPLRGTIRILRSVLSFNMVQVEDVYKRLNTFPAICPIIKTPLFGLAACVSRIKFPNREFTSICLLDCYLQFIRKDSAGQTGVCVDTVSSVGELCLRGQFRGQFEFTEADLLQAGVKEPEALRLGLLNRLTAQRIQPVYRVFHVCFQEYLAAVRMNELMTSSVPEEREQSQKYLEEIDSVATFLCFLHFLTFTSTRSERAATIVTDYTLNRINKNAAFNADKAIKAFHTHHPEIRVCIDTFLHAMNAAPDLRITVTDTFLFDQVLRMLIDSPYLPSCSPIITEGMKGKTFLICFFPLHGLFYFISQYPESIKGIKSFHLHIIKKITSFDENDDAKRDDRFQITEPPAVEQELAGSFSDPERLRTEKRMFKHLFNWVIGFLSTLIPEEFIDWLCSAYNRHEYKIPLLRMSIMFTRQLTEKELGNLSLLFFLSDSVVLDLIHSSGIVQELHLVLEKYAAKVKELYLLSNQMSEEEQAILASLTNLRSLTLMCTKADIPAPGSLCALPAGFSKVVTLRKLHLNNNMQEEDTILAWLLAHFPLLSSFVLESDSCPGLEGIIGALPCASLQELKLGCIVFTDSQLSSFVAQLGRFTNLKVLKLCNEVFDSVEVMPAFACALQKLKNLEVLHLPFGRGMKEAAEMIIKACQTLPCLRSLRMHSCLNDDSLVTFAKAIQNGHFLGLHKLIIDHSINTTERGWQELFHCLGRLSNLVKVDISRPVSHLMKPSSRLVVTFVRAIAQLPRIQHVLLLGWLLDEMDRKLFKDMKKRHPQSRHISLTYKIHVQPKIVESV